MKSSVKIAAICLAASVCTAGVCFAAYTAVIPHSGQTSAVGSGVNVASSYLTLDVTPPSGNSSGISPLELNISIDCSALSAAEICGSTAVLNISVGYSSSAVIGGYEEAATAALASAEYSAEAHSSNGATEVTLEGSCSGEGGDTLLSLRASFALPQDMCYMSVSIAVGSSQDCLALFMANADSLFSVSCYISAD